MLLSKDFLFKKGHGGKTRLAALTINGTETWWQSCPVFFFLFHLNKFSQLKNLKSSEASDIYEMLKRQMNACCVSWHHESLLLCRLRTQKFVCLMLLWYFGIWCRLFSCFMFSVASALTVASTLTKTLYNMDNNIYLDLCLFKGLFFSNWTPVWLWLAH